MEDPGHISRTSSNFHLRVAVQPIADQFNDILSLSDPQGSARLPTEVQEPGFVTKATKEQSPNCGQCYNRKYPLYTPNSAIHKLFPTQCREARVTFGMSLGPMLGYVSLCFCPWSLFGQSL